jgi:hypothetical protein
MPENITIAAFVLGAVMLLIAIVGGKFKIFGAEVSAMAGPTGRTFAGVLGSILIAIGLYSSLPTKAGVTKFRLKMLTCIKPQDKDGKDEVYLKWDKPPRIQFEFSDLTRGKSVPVDRVVNAGEIVYLYERDWNFGTGEDDLLGNAKVQGRGGTLQFRGFEHRDYHYTLSYEPEPES